MKLGSLFELNETCVESEKNYLSADIICLPKTVTFEE